METTITQEEKIDYIYDTLKKNEKRALIWTFLKWGFRIFLLWYMFYFIKVGLPLLIDSFIPSFPSWENAAISTEEIQSVISKYLSK